MYFAASKDSDRVARAALWAFALRRTDEGNGLPLVAAINAEIFQIHSDHRQFRMQFAHADETEIGEIRPPIGIPGRKRLKLRQMVNRRKGNSHETVSQH